MRGEASIESKIHQQKALFKFQKRWAFVQNIERQSTHFWTAFNSAFRLNDQDQIKYVSRIIQVVILLRRLCWQTNIEFVLLTSNEIDYNNVKWSNRTLVHKQLWSEFQGSNIKWKKDSRKSPSCLTRDITWNDLP